MDKINYLTKLPTMTVKARHSITGEMFDVLVDGDYDGEWFSTLKLRLLPNGYVQVSDWERQTLDPDTGLGTGIIQQGIGYLHQLVLPPMKGYWTGFRDGNKLNCTSANLYYRTPTEAALTRKQNSYRRSRAGYRGVQPMIKTLDGKTVVIEGRWVCWVKGRYAGSFNSPEDAARKYDELARKEYGDMATLNFPNEGGDK